jgi:hypothetical protein
MTTYYNDCPFCDERIDAHLLPDHIREACPVTTASRGEDRPRDGAHAGERLDDRGGSERRRERPGTPPWGAGGEP